MKKTYLILVLAIAGVFGVVFLGNFQSNETQAKIDPSLPIVTVYKNSGCNCCNKWVKHMEDSGFRVEAHNVNNMQKHKENAKLGVGMGSCHTAFVGDYSIEGHVPAWDVKRMLKEKPDISGLTVPRMPVGTPGMEIPGKPADPYQVISFKDGKEVGVFSDYPANAKGVKQ